MASEMAVPKRFGPIWLIAGDNRGKYPFCNSVYVAGARVLIDPGSDRAALIQLREDQGVDQVWLSHWHEDHITHLDLFDDLPLWIAQQDAPPLASLEAFIDSYALEDDHLRQLFAATLTETFHFSPRQPARTFDGDETVVLSTQGATTTVRVMHTPGHTPGHCAFYFEEQGVVFTGDYDLTPFGPWYGDPGSSIEQTRRSVRRLQALNAPLCLTAHEDGVFESPAAEVWDRYLQVIEHRERRYLAFLSEPRSMADIVAQWIVYRKAREPLPFFEHGERATAAKHLESLVARGQVQRLAGEGEPRWVRR
jgi:hydroxyacylglutathione hydrolase